MDSIPKTEVEETTEGTMAPSCLEAGQSSSFEACTTQDSVTQLQSCEIYANAASVLHWHLEEPACQIYANACLPLKLILCDAALLLHFSEFVVRHGKPEMATAAYAASTLAGSAQIRNIPDETLGSIDEALGGPLLDYYVQHEEGLPASFVWTELAVMGRQTSDNIKTKLSYFHEAEKGVHPVDAEHEKYAFAMCLVRGVRLAVELQERFIKVLDNTASGNAGDSENLASDSAFRTLLHWCGPSVDIPAIQKHSLRRFHVPREGNFLSAPHVIPFVFEDAAPGIFQRLRALAGISLDHYLFSLCREDVSLIEFGTNSKSGEFFFFSHDLRFLVKTLSNAAAQKLISTLPAYEQHLIDNPESLLVRYVGLHRVVLERSSRQPGGTRWFTVMLSVFPSSFPMHEKFDMKGSTHNRKSKEDDLMHGLPGKDLDLDAKVSADGPLKLTCEAQTELLQHHHSDTCFLRDHDIVDYSVLLGIHHFGAEYAEDHKSALNTRFSVQLCSDVPPPLARILSPGSQRPIRGSVTSSDETEFYVFGIIDTLEEYDMRRKLQYLAEGTLGVLTRARGTHSIVPAVQYQKRQEDFFKRILGVEHKAEEASPIGVDQKVEETSPLGANKATPAVKVQHLPI